MALLPVHSQNFASLRKNSFKTACRRAIARSERYRGQVLTPRLLRRTGNCPPPSRNELMAQPNNSSARGTASRRAGQQVRHVRVMSWNAGHLGQQQWGELNLKTSPSTPFSAFHPSDSGSWKGAPTGAKAAPLPVKAAPGPPLAPSSLSLTPRGRT